MARGIGQCVQALKDSAASKDEEQAIGAVADLFGHFVEAVCRIADAMSRRDD